MEINLLIRIQSLQELRDWVTMMEAFPAMGKVLNIERTFEDLSKKVEGLTREVQELEAKKASLNQSPSPQ